MKRREFIKTVAPISLLPFALNGQPIRAYGKLLGVNNFGFRLRHHAFDKWFKQERTVEYVLEHLKDANFDPELFKTYEQAIVDQFNAENNTNIQLKKKSWKRILELVSN